MDWRARNLRHRKGKASFEHCSATSLEGALHVRAQQYVDELRCCLGLEAADQPLTPAAVRVVKLANEIVSFPFTLLLWQD